MAFTVYVRRKVSGDFGRVTFAAFVWLVFAGLMVLQRTVSGDIVADVTSVFNELGRLLT